MHSQNTNVVELKLSDSKEETNFFIEKPSKQITTIKVSYFPECSFK